MKSRFKFVRVSTAIDPTTWLPMQCTVYTDGSQLIRIGKWTVVH